MLALLPMLMYLYIISNKYAIDDLFFFLLIRFHFILIFDSENTSTIPFITFSIVVLNKLYLNSINISINIK